ncbi:hypothetical protein LH704_15060 [Burkholderia cenocepacia]|uniref:DUF6708 domain-containing protein n=1 Tax=Burkholderia cenocepacia TaxID=95486 RepID=UPI001F317544|nr:DUF6708 domain-containing protein [Burkholderia cenocepacia]MCF1367982.1 hypothetical protein [Burkholderia cenocepacia]MCF1385515.1 hypothetical protein [Burkholderia cenocepacia]
MDERLMNMKKCIGAPIPEWDRAHRLSISQPVGPEIKDLGTIFSINSTFMDVIDPALLDKQWVILAVLIAFLATGIGPYVYWLTFIRYPGNGGVFEIAISIFAILLFGSIVWRLGRGLFFGLLYRPIRFHRATRTLYSIRARRFFSKPGEGDVVWKTAWNDDAIFCLHQEVTPYGTVFHIRHYTVDDQDNVTRVFSIGREWTSSQARLALAQWNYWCMYMNNGPHSLPKPMLFHTKHETPRESFLYALYNFGMNVPLVMRLIAMPAVLSFTIMRMLANVTCRAPVWPEAIARISVVAPDDLYAEPRASTPVGWAETVLAQQRGDYPDDDHARVPNWTSEPDGLKYAAAWLKDPATAARLQRDAT